MIERFTSDVSGVSSIHHTANHLESSVPQVLVEHQEQQRVDEGVNKANMQRHLIRYFLLLTPRTADRSHLVSHGVLGLLPVTGVVNQSHQEERGPEDEIGRGDDHVHLDPGDALRLQVPDVLLDLHALRRADREEVLTVLLLGFDGKREQSVDSQGLNVGLGEVLVELPQVEDGQHDAEEIDQDPDGIEDIVSVGALT